MKSKFVDTIIQDFPKYASGTYKISNKMTTEELSKAEKLQRGFQMFVYFMSNVSLKKTNQNPKFHFLNF